MYKLPKIYINYVIFMLEKIRQKNFCGPQYNILMKFGPSENKSGHPCYKSYLLLK
jgi:hypothetical protein